MIDINTRLFIYLLLILFLLIGPISASTDTTIQKNPDEHNNYETITSQKDSSNFNEQLTNNPDKTKKNNKLVSSKDNNHKLNNFSNNEKISNKNEPQYIVINDSKYYTSTDSIQNIINKSNPGSTIEFIGSLYKDLSLTINKPLTIISKSNTTIITTTDLPVFNIITGGSRTTISGFTINTQNSFVNATNVSNINIEKNKISKSKNGITFYNVFNSKIQNNTFTKFKTAINITKSELITISQNNIKSNDLESIGINLEENTDSKKIKILNNTLIGPNDIYHDGNIGIKIGANVFNISLKENIIKNWAYGIYFEDSANNVNITNNTFTGNILGMYLKKGILNGFSFTKNIVTDSLAYGIELDEEYAGHTSNPIVENNFFTRNGMDMRSVGNYGFAIGKNFAKNLCYKFYMRFGFKIKFLGNSDKIIASVTSNGNPVKDLPDFQGTLNINGKEYNVLFKRGIGYLDLSGTDAGDNLGNQQFTIGDDERILMNWGNYVQITDEELKNYLQEYFGYSNTNESNNNSKPNNTNTSSNSDSKNENSGTKNSQNENSGTEKTQNENSGTEKTQNENSGTEKTQNENSVSNGNSYVNSNTINPTKSTNSANPIPSSKSTSSTQSVSSSGHTSQDSSSASDSSSSSPSEASNSKETPSSSVSSASSSSSSSKVVAKKLSIDEENFKIVGVGGLILLIILVIGMYYREDFSEMVKK